MSDHIEREPFEIELPTHCAGCGAYLMGGATEHTPECPIRKLIEEQFPGLKPPEPLPCPACGGDFAGEHKPGCKYVAFVAEARIAFNMPEPRPYDAFDPTKTIERLRAAREQRDEE